MPVVVFEETLKWFPWLRKVVWLVSLRFVARWVIELMGDWINGWWVNGWMSRVRWKRLNRWMDVWDRMGRDGMGSDGIGWHGMGWDLMGWDGMGMNEMGWDGIYWWIFFQSLFVTLLIRTTSPSPSACSLPPPSILPHQFTFSLNQSNYVSFLFLSLH